MKFVGQYTEWSLADCNRGKSGDSVTWVIPAAVEQLSHMGGGALRDTAGVVGKRFFKKYHPSASVRLSRTFSKDCFYITLMRDYVSQKPFPLWFKSVCLFVAHQMSLQFSTSFLHLLFLLDTHLNFLHNTTVITFSNNVHYYCIKPVVKYCT